MKYSLYFVDLSGEIKDITPFEAYDDEAAIFISSKLARSSSDRRTELWSGERLVMRRSYPEPDEMERAAD